MNKMSNKIPCGGFYLDDTLGVDENGKLGVNVDALSGGLIVNLTKDETIMEFTSSKRLYTADRKPDEIYSTIFSGKNIILRANYIDAGGHELQGVYHLAGFYNGQISFICVTAIAEAIIASEKAVKGYDTIILSSSGRWVGSYTDLQNSSVTQTS